MLHTKKNEQHRGQLDVRKRAGRFKRFVCVRCAPKLSDHMWIYVYVCEYCRKSNSSLRLRLRFNEFGFWASCALAASRKITYYYDDMRNGCALRTHYSVACVYDFHCQWCTRHVRKVVVNFMMFSSSLFPCTMTTKRTSCAFIPREIIDLYFTWLRVCVLQLRYTGLSDAFVCVYIYGHV